jgi:ankyrin repeat protein
MSKEKGTNLNILNKICRIEGISLEEIKLLVDGRVDLNSQEECKNTPLHYACGNLNINLEIVRYLLANKSDLNLENGYNDSPVHFASRNPNISGEIVKYLIENKYDVNHKNCYGNNILHEACRNRSIDPQIVKYLIESKGEINELNIYGNTPLHHACENSKDASLEIIDYLIINKADLNIKNSYNSTPWKYICKFHDINLVKNVLEALIPNFKQDICMPSLIGFKRIEIKVPKPLIKFVLKDIWFYCLATNFDDELLKEYDNTIEAVWACMFTASTSSQEQENQGILVTGNLEDD